MLAEVVVGEGEVRLIDLAKENVATLLSAFILPVTTSRAISNKLFSGDIRADKPQNGSMILYNRKKVKYRKDGYCWKKRKDGKTTREDHMKLKVQGVEVTATCYPPEPPPLLSPPFPCPPHPTVASGGFSRCSLGYLCAPKLQSYTVFLAPS
ncbi:hypothetical protein ACEWY4_013111 [Coilia grayii]|uniref:CG-1 domain-containing protein n=1 Tax=Coilia grayii TaxID=363190 RepID=A0ABD1JVD1_9TELE